ncbi:MAG: dockerin type I domain-containing protein [Candidatus Poribacteria bacterium]|nr:dockerin type I domain-containing protein [Candidatus Poribacteria bacterium]
MRTLVFVVSLCLFCLVLDVSAQPPIHLIYFKPSDVEMPSQRELDALVDVVVEVQFFFAFEMEKHGFGPKTFNFYPDVKVLKGELKRSQYNKPLTIQKEVPSVIEFGLDNEVYVVFLGGHSPGGIAASSQQLCAYIPEQLQYCNNLVVVPSESKFVLDPLLAHELGHAFNISTHASKRLIKNRVDVMYYPLITVAGVKQDLKKFAFSLNDATILNDTDRLSVQQDPHRHTQEIDADVNGDGYIDLSDVRIVRSAIQNTVQYDTDVNGDGKTDELDVLIVKAKAHEAIVAAAPSLQYKRILTGTWGALKRRYKH